MTNYCTLTINPAGHASQESAPTPNSRFLSRSQGLSPAVQEGVTAAGGEKWPPERRRRRCRRRRQSFVTVPAPTAACASRWDRVTVTSPRRVDR